MGQPEDITDAILDLASDEWQRVTGSPVTVDDGYLVQWGPDGNRTGDAAARTVPCRVEVEGYPGEVRHEAKRSVMNFVGTALGGCRDEAMAIALEALARSSARRRRR
jgi:hypothetical protein